MKPFRFSLTFAILSSLAFLLLLTWFLVSLISFKTSENDLISQKNEQGRVLLAAFINLLPAELAAGSDMAAAGRFAAGLSAERGFAGITVVDRQGRVVYSRGDGGGTDPNILRLLKNGGESGAITGDGMFIARYAPITAGGTTVGAARLTLSLQAAHERLTRSRQMFLAYFVLDFLLLLGLGAYLLSRFIVVPIKRLLAATERIAEGDLNYRVSVPGGAEIADLGEAFNKMVEALKAKRDDIERHVQSLEDINRELQSARHEAIRSEKMASIGLLAAGTAHEIGTPLAAIMGYADILRAECRDDPEKTDYLRRIEAESERIDRIVRSLLDYARPSALECRLVDVADLLQATLVMLEEQGALKKIVRSVQIEDNLAPVLTDRHQLQQVFINLVINARDAMPGGGTLTVRAAVSGADTELDAGCSSMPSVTRGRRKNDFGGAFIASFRHDCRFVRIDFRDTGEGIDAENLERIFDPFFTTKEPGQGTGLGLAISARIIDSFGGRITVESSRGGGSTFSVWLPVANKFQDGDDEC